MEDLVEEVHALAAPPAEQTELKPEDLTGGREVMVRSLGQRGTIVEVSGKTVQVQIGPMRVTVEVDDLAPVAEPEKKEKTPRRVTTLYVAKNVSRELDLRGLTLDEAILKVDMYLDEAAVSSLKEVRLIHGKGTGRLRAGLRQHLHKHPRVASQRLGHPAEGGNCCRVEEGLVQLNFVQSQPLLFYLSSVSPRCLPSSSCSVLPVRRDLGGFVLPARGSCGSSVSSVTAYIYSSRDRS